MPQPWPWGLMGAGTAPASRVQGHSATALLAAAAALTPIDDGVASMIASLISLCVPEGGLCLTHSFMVFTVVLWRFGCSSCFVLLSGCLEVVQQQWLLKQSLYWSIFPAC